MKKHIRKTAVLSILTTVALVLSYVEAILPPIWAAVPGIKIGLPNIIIIFILYKTGFKDAITVSAIRLFLVALLFGNAMTLLYSAAGAILSIVLMTLCKKIDLFSMVGVSIVGGVAHNLGQILVAMAIFETSQIGYYMLVLAVTGTIAGVFVGVAASIILKRFERIKI